MTSEPFDFTSAGVRLEGRLHAGDGNLIAIVLHPHPQYGGDMDNHVVVACCEALATAGLTALRFNFRGAGRSAGMYEEGRGEREGALAAIAAMRERYPGTPLLLVGYSFGAMIAASVADDTLAGLALISPPTAGAPLPAIARGLQVLVATGDRDHISPAENVSSIESEAVKVAVFEGVDHGWWPGIEGLTDTLVSFSRTLTPAFR